MPRMGATHSVVPFFILCCLTYRLAFLVGYLAILCAGQHDGMSNDRIRVRSYYRRRFLTRIHQTEHLVTKGMLMESCLNLKAGERQNLSGARHADEAFPADARADDMSNAK